MNRPVFSRLAAAAVVVALSLAPVPAQARPWEEPKGGDTAAGAPRGHARPMPGAKPVRPSAKQRAAAVTTMALPDCQTSKYTDPTGTGVLRVDQGCDLDRYMYESDGPLDFSILVDRYAGPVTAEGYPAAGHAYADRKALLTLRAWDVDDDYAVGGEVDRVGVNGHAIDAPSYGILTGAHDQWSTVSFHIDASKLKFPAAPGEVAVNDFTVLIDTANPGTNTWAVSIDWAELRLSSDVLPVALMHGIISTGEAMLDMKAFYEENVWQLAGKIITPSLTFNGSTYLNELMMREPIAALKRDTGAEQINLVAHSMGGLNSRRYAWLHPGDVRNVVMIGTPNGGSPVADHLCEIKNSYDGDPNEYEALILIIGHKFGSCDGPADGLYQLQTSYMQNVFNVQVRDHAAGTEYATIAGEGWDLTSVYVPGQSDGVVAVDSVRWMDRNGSHGGVHTSLEPIFPQNHGDLIKTGSGALGRSLCHAYAAQYACYRIEESSGLRTMAATAGDPVELADIGTATIPAGGTAQIPLALEAASTAQVLILTEPGVTGSYKGQPLSTGQLFGEPVLVAQTTGGAGTVTLHNSTGAQVKAAAVGSVATTRQLAVAGPVGLPTAGSPVTATMALTEAVAGEQVRYRVLDGAGAEVVEGVAVGAGTGTWSATFTPAGAGTYTVAAWTTGTRPRSASAVVPVGADDGRGVGAGATWLAPDANTDGRLDALEVSVPVTAPQGGEFHLTGDLIAAGGQVVGSAGGTAQIGAGTGSVTLRFGGQAIFRSGLNGPYTLGNLVLSDAEQNLLDRVTVQATSSGYTAGQFDHLDVELDLQGFTDEQVDADSNRYAEQLRVGGRVRVDAGGSYAINARLVGPNGQELVEHQQTAVLTAGQNQITLNFPWSAIAAGGVNGPYTVMDLSVYPINNAGNGAFLPSAHTTEALHSSGLVNRVPLVHIEPVTVEGNTAGGYTGTLPGASAEDPDGDPVTLTNNAPSPLPLGVNSVVWTGTDTYGGTGTTVQSVTVRDTTAPSITCPPNATVTTATPTLGNPATSDIVDATVTVTNNKPATFPSGLTTVTWTARDDSGNAATCQQQVTVNLGVPAGPYAFTGFWTGGSSTPSLNATCKVPPLPYNMCFMDVSWQVKDSSGNVISNPAVVKSISWAGNVSAISFSPTTGRMSVSISENGVPTPSWYNFTLIFADGTRKTLRVQMVEGAPEGS